MMPVSFEQLCAFVAIRKTQDTDEALRHLILHVIELFPDVLFREASDFQQVVHTALGLEMASVRIQGAIDGCVGRGLLRRVADGCLILKPDIQSEIKHRVSAAAALEDRVRSAWLAHVTNVAPDLSSASAWTTLHSYLTLLFRQHGLQTMALVDPEVRTPPELEVNLRYLLGTALEKHCPHEHRLVLQNLIEAFFAGVSGDPDKIAFIVHFADSVVSYYSLVVRPEVAEKLRTELKPLTLFLDTNVLFGLLGLDNGPNVDISNELVQVVEKHKLPLRLRYHSETELELRHTFEGATSGLMGFTWSPQISRAAVASRHVSTIQRIYHERNASRPVTAQTFFAPYKHLDVLLQEKGIKIYREADSTRHDVYELIADYEGFLKKHEREKSYEARDHDMTLLHCVRRLRSKATSSLQAEALLVTYDYLLHSFDRGSSRRNNDLPCTVLPSQLLQLLRPFLTITEDFDRSFAETFAIPQFRAMGGKAHVAVGRMLQLLASYEGLSEQAATSILTNDMVLDGLKKAKTDAQLREYVESAIAVENATLIQEKRQLQEALEIEKARVEGVAKESEARVRAELEGNARTLANNLRQTEESAAALANSLETEKAKVARTEDVLSTERQTRENVTGQLVGVNETVRQLEGRLSSLESAKKAAEARSKFAFRLLIGIVTSMVLIFASEFVVRIVQWNWLLIHPNSYGLRGAFYLAIIGLAVGMADLKRWKLWIPIVVVGAVLVILQLIGGPNPG